mgnify:FL=1
MVLDGDGWRRARISTAVADPRERRRAMAIDEALAAHKQPGRLLSPEDCADLATFSP